MLARLSQFVRSNGMSWTLYYVMRNAGLRFLRWNDERILKLERENMLVSNDLLSSKLNSLIDNINKWDPVDWNEVGREWTEDAGRFKGLNPEEWKERLLNRFLWKYYPAGKPNILEIGPGGGRWTEQLLKRECELYIVDVSKTAIEKCSELFAGKSNLHTHLVKPGSTPLIPSSFLAPECLDFIWSYDVFVHINPNDIDAYLGEFSKLLKRGGLGVIHHAGDYESERRRLKWFRSNMSGPFFAHLLRKWDLELVEQDTEHAHFPGDVITVFRKP